MDVAEVQVAIADDYIATLNAVVRRCKRAGLKLTHQFEAIGIITGVIETERIDDLRKVKGVSAVESIRDYQIAPPEDEIQ